MKAKVKTVKAMAKTVKAKEQGRREKKRNQQQQQVVRLRVTHTLKAKMARGEMEAGQQGEEEKEWLTQTQSVGGCL